MSCSRLTGDLGFDFLWEAKTERHPRAMSVASCCTAGALASGAAAGAVSRTGKESLVRTEPAPGRGPIPGPPQGEPELIVAPWWGQFPFVSLTDRTGQIRQALGWGSWVAKSTTLPTEEREERAFSNPYSPDPVSSGAALSPIASPSLFLVSYLILTRFGVFWAGG